MAAAKQLAKSPVPPKKVDHPKDWEPSVEYDGTRGKACIPTQKPLAEDDKEAVLLKEAGFNPKTHRIAGAVNYRKWMRYDQEWLHYYKFDVVERTPDKAQRKQLAVDDLVKAIRKPRVRSVPTGSPSGCFLFNAADWQIGKGEGDGTEGTIDRVLGSIDLAKQRIKDLRRIGHGFSEGALVGLGDLHEGICGFYPHQQFSIDLNDREQARIVRMLTAFAIEELSPLFDKFTVGTVGGNHGQKRQDGKAITDDSDNKDVEAFDAVYEAFTRDSRYDNVSWVIPDDELAILLELGGIPVGFTHGDLFEKAGGTLPQAKAFEWWKMQDFGMQALRGAKILISGHFHHYSCLTNGGRTHFQTPAMDPGSQYFTNSRGQSSPPGALTMVLDKTEPFGWRDVQILLPKTA